jgi:hypothetical protein
MSSSLGNAMVGKGAGKIEGAGWSNLLSMIRGDPLQAASMPLLSWQLCYYGCDHPSTAPERYPSPWVGLAKTLLQVIRGKEVFIPALPRTMKRCLHLAELVLQTPGCMLELLLLTKLWGEGPWGGWLVPSKRNDSTVSSYVIRITYSLFCWCFNWDNLPTVLLVSTSKVIIQKTSEKGQRRAFSYLEEEIHPFSCHEAQSILNAQEPHEKGLTGYLDCIWLGAGTTKLRLLV